MKNKIFKVLDNVITVMCIVLVVWIVASWVNINQHNNPMQNDYKDYANWNMFEVFEVFNVEQIQRNRTKI